jgi:dUTP pyrophosphatase
MNVNFKKLNENAVAPKYASVGDAGMDLVAVSKHMDMMHNLVIYDTGIAVEIPEGYVGLIFPRSSIRKYDLELTNSVGVIDSGYRGTIQFVFRITEHNFDKPRTYDAGDRIGQLLILPYPTIQLNEVTELTTTLRGDGGFGSTGV